jgi:hypothetical protein
VIAFDVFSDQLHRLVPHRDVVELALALETALQLGADVAEVENAVLAAGLRFLCLVHGYGSLAGRTWVTI